MLICDQWLQLCFEDGDDVQCLVDFWAARNDLNRFFPQHKQVISHKKTPELGCCESTSAILSVAVHNFIHTGKKKTI